jgi:hypothetical protein
MEKPNAISSLKESIRLLEIRQAEEGKIFKEQFGITLESFKPINLIKSSLKNLTDSAELKNNLFGTVISIISGYLTKKLMVGPKSNAFMKILGTIMQFGITSVIAKNADNIRNFLNDQVDRIFHPEENDAPEIEV